MQTPKDMKPTFPIAAMPDLRGWNPGLAEVSVEFCSCFRWSQKNIDRFACEFETTAGCYWSWENYWNSKQGQIGYSGVPANLIFIFIYVLAWKFGDDFISI